MKKEFWISASVILCGLIILMLPDNGQRLFSFNKDHGPSLQDFIGLMLIIIGWIYWVTKALQQRMRIYSQIKLRGLIIIILLLTAGLVLIISGLQNENNGALYAGIGMSVAAYLFPVLIAFRRY